MSKNIFSWEKLGEALNGLKAEIVAWERYCEEEKVDR